MGDIRTFGKGWRDGTCNVCGSPTFGYDADHAPSDRQCAGIVGMNVDFPTIVIAVLVIVAAITWAKHGGGDHWPE